MFSKYSVLIYLDSCRKSDLRRVRMRVRWSAGYIAADVGHNIEVDKWDPSCSRCRRNTFHGPSRVTAAVINSTIQFFEDKAREVMDSFDHVPSKDEYRAALLPCLKPTAAPSAPVQSSLFDDWDSFVNEQGKDCGWSMATYKKMTTMRNHLLEWGGESLSYEALGEDGLSSLMNYFVESGKKNGTITRYIKVVKWFLRWADHRGKCSMPEAINYKPHLKDVKKRVIFLTWSELMAVYGCSFDDDESRLELARDKFCFSCFTGLRYSDVVSLAKTDITEVALFKTTQKTHDPLRIELNKYSRAIWEKYKDSDGPFLFPKISNQKMNKYLKEVGKKCGLVTPITETYYVGGTRKEKTFKKWELLTTHCGRRTFICNALMLGIPADVVMKWTGHSDYKAMRPYIDIADETKKLAMALFDEK